MKSTKMPVEKQAIIFKFGTFSVDLALRGIEAVLRERHVPFQGFRLYGDPVNLLEALPRLNEAKRKTFNIVGNDFEFDLSCVRNFHLDFLEIKYSGERRCSWDTWAAQFIGNRNFVMAWVADADYEFWQNAEDPLQYVTKGKEYNHLPKRSNGLPFPLERTVIDISSNPGRRLLRDGYYEVVGAVMWLGETFWQLVGTERERVKNADWIHVSNPIPSVTKIEVSAECFSTSVGVNGELQNRVRSLLFGNRSALKEMGNHAS